MGTRIVAVCAVLAIVMGARPAQAEEAVQDVVTVVLEAGERFEATIVGQDEATLTFRTASGRVRTIDRRLIRYVTPPPAGGPTPPLVDPDRPDPNETRLMLVETGRPLGKGNGHLLSSYAITIPLAGAAYGITDHLSVSGGFSAAADSGYGDQLFYAAAKAGWKLSPRTAFALGGLYVARGHGAGDQALLVGVATFGPPSGSLSVGAALRASQQPEPVFGPDHEFQGFTESWRVEPRPLLFVGGTLRLGRQVSLVAETWLFLGSFEASSQPVGVALRMFGKRVSVDVGVLTAADFLTAGYPPVPWVSLSFHFGPSRGEAKQRLAAPAPVTSGARRFIPY